MLQKKAYLKILHQIFRKVLNMSGKSYSENFRLRLSPRQNCFLSFTPVESQYQSVVLTEQINRYSWLKNYKHWYVYPTYLEKLNSTKVCYHVKYLQKKMFVPYRIAGVFLNGSRILLWRFIHFHNTEWFRTTYMQNNVNMTV